MPFYTHKQYKKCKKILILYSIPWYRQCINFGTLYSKSEWYIFEGQFLGYFVLMNIQKLCSRQKDVQNLPHMVFE